jgi:hypothetical protein
VVQFDVGGSWDPDGDKLTLQLISYPEVGTYKGDVQLGTVGENLVAFTAPTADQPQTVHLILIGTDNGEPALTRYQRVVVEILPRN